VRHSCPCWQLTAHDEFTNLPGRMLAECR
jgi:hypothetical protein